MDEDSIFSHFDLLHELIQVIYQGSHRFVLLSQVDDSGWTIHLGLSGHGRWWSGKWTTETVMKIAVSVHTPFLSNSVAYKPFYRDLNPLQNCSRISLSVWQIQSHLVIYVLETGAPTRAQILTCIAPNILLSILLSYHVVDIRTIR
jgi:hypothetical protein